MLRYFLPGSQSCRGSKSVINRRGNYNCIESKMFFGCAKILGTGFFGGLGGEFLFCRV